MQHPVDNLLPNSRAQILKALMARVDQPKPQVFYGCDYIHHDHSFEWSARLCNFIAWVRQQFGPRQEVR
jgi:hypothetical protein